MSVFLLDDRMDQWGRAVSRALPRRGRFVVLNTLLVFVLLALALCWVWLRAATREDARRLTAHRWPIRCLQCRISTKALRW